MQNKSIHVWIDEAASELKRVGIDSAHLDAELILSHTVRKPRTWLHMYRDEELSERHQEIANARLELRLDNVPLAYIIGHREFYGRRFMVSPAVLIPRPESEQLIELLAEALPDTQPLPDVNTLRLIDIGTGSGALGVTAKLEHTELDVTLLDISRPALTLAEKNAEALGAVVTTMQSDLLESYPFTPDIALANLPYVDTTWERSPETGHEPQEALFAADNGLALIKKCLEALSVRMQPGGIAIFEADPRQWQDIIAYAKEHHFEFKQQRDFAALFVKT